MITTEWKPVEIFANFDRFAVVDRKQLEDFLSMHKPDSDTVTNKEILKALNAKPSDFESLGSRSVSEYIGAVLA